MGRPIHLSEAPCSYRIPFEGENIVTGYVDSVKTAIADLNNNDQDVAAIMIDSIFDCPGTVEAPKGYFSRAYQTVRNADGLVIADEVQSGFCRTGAHWWGFQQDRELVIHW